MSNGLGKLFQQNKQTTVVSKYLKETSAETVDGIESPGHLSESIKRRDTLVPPVDYSDPENFVKFGSAEKYYDDSMTYIADYYPYDGPASEKVKFYNELNPLEKYILDEQYPGSTGYVVFNSNWGTKTAARSGYASASATPSEFIQVKGGPHSGTIYSTPSNRTSNLEFGGPSGSTVEFFYKKNEGMPNSAAQGEKQVIFDAWNGQVSSSVGYGRLRIEVFSGSEDRFHVTMMSGTTGYFTQSVPTTGNINICSGSWNHYAFVFNTDISVPTLDFYIDGNCWETNITASGHQAGEIGLVTGSLLANLGALRAATSGSLEGTTDTELTYQGYGKLSASLDEFRFWKTNRNPQQIGRYWFTHVNGGSDRFDENKDLGVYFKFNEGITGIPAIDKITLDYSGRISNGTFTAYNETYSRNLGSAVNTLRLTNVSESLDPIIRKENPNFLSKRTELSSTGSLYDFNNSSRLINQIPAWIIEEDENSGGEIKNLVQIMSNYFDTTYVQIQYLTKLKNVDYVSGSLTGSIKEFPYVDRLLTNVGLETPEIFENISALAQFDQRDEKIKFDQTLINTKNLIYRNIYNNLSFIYKSKGTAKSIRNFIRCLGVDEDIIALNAYANNSQYYLTSSYRTVSSTKKYADFSGLSSAQSNQATVYQYYDSSNPDSYGIINGSGSATNLEEFAFTVEGEFIFPDKSNIDNLNFVPYLPVTSSLFGYHTPQYPTPTSTDLTWIGSNHDWGLQVYAVKTPGQYATIYSPLERVQDVYFAVENRAGETILTSSVFSEVYTNQKWNLALSVKPKKWPFAEGVLGTSFAGGTALEYEAELYGVSYEGDIKRGSFSSTVDLKYTSGSAMVNSAKRLYAGAHRTNFNGNLLEYGDTRATSIRYWSDYIPNSTIDLHAKESFSFGTKNPYRNAYSFQTKKPNVYIPQIQTLALNWDFANLSSSNPSGQFNVSDFSSGSVNGGYISDYQDGANSTFSDINLRQHTGLGDFFPESTTVVEKQYIHTGKLQPVDYSLSDEMIRILDSDDEYFTINYRPQNLFFAIEKSLYRSISERMLQLFASIDEFNNLVGEPVNKYRQSYKNLEKLREIFFRNVEGPPDFEKYVKFYKWLDVSMGEMIQQLMPASVAKAENVRTIIENHSLERPKIHYKYPGSYKTRMPEAGGTIRNLGSICPDDPGWKYNHAPLNSNDSLAQQNVNCFWWQTKALRSNGHLNITTLNQPSANAILTAVQQEHSSSKIVCLSAKLNFPYLGGINQHINKRRNIKDVVFSTFESLEDCSDEREPNTKTTIAFKATKDGTNYKGELLAPFTTISSSNTLGGYQSTLLKGGLTGINIVNLHEDVIHPFDNSVPMQTPFTQQHVGGFQARHVAPMSLPTPDTSPSQPRRESHFLNVAGGQIEIGRIITGSVPKGHYLRGLASKSPLNIENIKSFTGSLTPADGANILGNYKLGYQILQTGDRDAANMDFVFNTGSYYTGSIPTAFVTPLTMRSQSVPYHNDLVIGRTGSVDYSNPRQRSSRRTNQNVFVSRFAAPGGKLESRQQFRDITLDQLSPNNALPFRNIPVRQVYNTNLKTFSGWGGFVSSSGVDQLEAYGAQYLSNLNNGSNFTFGALTIVPATASIHQTQRNTTNRITILSTEATPGAGYTLGTGSVRDNGFITRPIPAADRSSWFMSLSGTNTPGKEMMDQFILSSSHYPKNITITTSSLTAKDINAFGTAAIFSNSSGQTSFLWSTENVGFVPWSQLRQGDTTAGSYYWRNNVYEIPLITPQLTAEQRINFGSSTRTLGFYTTRTTADRAGNFLSYRYLGRFREAPVTSRYKPLIHHIKTHPGTAEETNYRSPVNVTVKYSYGNYLMGFANRELNNRYSGALKWNTNKIKRPYESFRDNHITELQTNVDGTDIIRLTSYAETVYPKEIYTYLSASRSRLAFHTNFWKNDKKVSTVNIGATPVTTLALLNTESNIETYNRSYPRMSSSFNTSQGYLLQRSEQISYDSVGSSEATGNGSGSIWPMDSYLYAESTSSLAAVADSAGFKVLLAGASTLPSGELMLTSHGEVRQHSSTPDSEYLRGNAVSAQYIYSAPAMMETCTATGAVAATASITALKYPFAGHAASGSLTLLATWSMADLHGSTITVGDASSTCAITFNTASSANAGTCAGADRSIGILTMDSDGNSVRDAIRDAIEDAATENGYAIIATAPSSGSVKVTADDVGTAGNDFILAWTPPSSAPTANDITAVDIAGGLPIVSLDGHQITLTSVVPGPTSKSHTMQFKEDGTAGSKTVIDVSSVGTSLASVATQIANSITAAHAAGDTDIQYGSVAGATVNLAVDTVGAAGNASTITGDAISTHGDVSATSPFAGGADAGTSCVHGVMPASPGGVYSRPAWVANTERRVVEGPSRGTLLAGRDPFYNSYEDYASDVRAKGQEYTIVPEYRMSEHLNTYEDNGDAFQLVSSTLAITGANSDNFDTTNNMFFDRYINTDRMEYLNPFIQEDTLDFVFNKYPRHFQIKSDAVIKLLPYEGFYPASRTLQIATLFSSSHTYSFTGASGSSRQAMRAMLRPYFAPGLLYNSIKSGIAVDYPIRRKGRGQDQYIPINAKFILNGALSGTLTSPVAGQIPGNNRRFNGNNPATVGQNTFDFSSANVNKFFWGDRLPFEALMSPENYLGGSKNVTVLSDINEVLYNDVTGSLKEGSPLYRKAISNFLASVPEFFLTRKTNLNGSNGYMTKFVSRFGKSSNTSDQSSGDPSATDAGQVYASSDTAYIMEIGLTKTNNFNLYNNPYAFGVPTATGSLGWDAFHSGSLGNSGAQRPSGSNWPTHYGEFAPFTPPYYYGTSVARITFTPSESRNYTLNEIVGNAADFTTIEFLNESGSYYDFDIGSYLDLNGDPRSTTGTPPYGWNRAWQNRMDIDASICLTNVFPLENGATTPADPNKWVIMPKWECPILDFPNWSSYSSAPYNFSSSVDLGQFDADKGTYGMWHQYGIMPQANEGVFMYIKDVDLKETELRLVGDPSAGSSSSTGQQVEVRKVPKWVIESGRNVGSLADLCGFDPNEVMRGSFQAEKAKRLGVLGETNEKVISEAILALPFYIDANNKTRFMTLKAAPNELGPKIKEFRRAFTKYSLPPALANRLMTLLPSSYPRIPSFVNPFGGDSLDQTLSGVELVTTPVVYLLEHAVNLSRQDLADIWQGIMPDIGSSLELGVTAIDHYMPGEKVEEEALKFPEIIQKQIELNIPRTGIPRVDLLDISDLPDRDGFNTEIKWFVFKVKRRGIKSYDKLISKEINGYEYDPYQAAVDALAPVLLGRSGQERVEQLRSTMAMLSYADNNAVSDPTYNWPYDYFSLVELDKLTTKVGFRPDLEKENAELDQIQQVQINENQNVVDGVAADPSQADADFGENARAFQNLMNNQNDGNY